MIQVNHAACESAAHRAAVISSESAARQRAEGDTHTRCSTHAVRGSTLELQQPRSTRTRSASNQADPRVVWRDGPGPLVPSLPSPQALVSAQTGHISNGKSCNLNQASRWNTKAAGPHSLPPQPLPSRGPLIAASCHRPTRRATMRRKRPRLAPSRRLKARRYALPCLAPLSLLRDAAKPAQAYDVS